MDERSVNARRREVNTRSTECLDLYLGGLGCGWEGFFMNKVKPHKLDECLLEPKCDIR